MYVFLVSDTSCRSVTTWSDKNLDGLPGSQVDYPIFPLVCIVKAITRRGDCFSCINWNVFQPKTV